ncbi:hypothetical protein AB0K00_49595 [Dactylosporangium sp. NPDC049525]|uniref:hypothetical protein n=1 Tax=Dactylosporangium sp. NPDC049525 TaxID=3154730 RepID=UPI00342DA619
MQRFARSGSSRTDLWVLAGSGIVTVLLTRWFLASAGYPKLGGGGLHIAHVLWGGLLLAAALGVALTYPGRPGRVTAAAVGGTGFGLFIDEVGKFVTERTDYFYRPAAGIIYLVFAALVVLVVRLRDPGHRTPDERTAEALRLALDGLPAGLTTAQRTEALRLLAPPAATPPSTDGEATVDGRATADGGATMGERDEVDASADGSGGFGGAADGRGEVGGAADGRGEVGGVADGRGEVGGAANGRGEVDGAANGRGEVDGAANRRDEVGAAVAALVAALPHRDSPWAARRHALAAFARRLVTRRVVAAAIVGVYVLQVPPLVGGAFEAVTGELRQTRELGASLAMVAAAAVAAVLAVRAGFLLRADRPRALRLLRASVLVDLLAGQIFKFTALQFDATVGLGLSLLLLAVLTVELHRSTVPHR